MSQGATRQKDNISYPHFATVEADWHSSLKAQGRGLFGGQLGYRAFGEARQLPLIGHVRCGRACLGDVDVSLPEHGAGDAPGALFVGKRVEVLLQYKRVGDSYGLAQLGRDAAPGLEVLFTDDPDQLAINPFPTHGIARHIKNDVQALLLAFPEDRMSRLNRSHVRDPFLPGSGDETELAHDGSYFWTHSWTSIISLPLKPEIYPRRAPTVIWCVREASVSPENIALASGGASSPRWADCPGAAAPCVPRP